MPSWPHDAGQRLPRCQQGPWKPGRTTWRPAAALGTLVLAGAAWATPTGGNSAGPSGCCEVGAHSVDPATPHPPPGWLHTCCSSIKQGRRHAALGQP